MLNRGSYGVQGFESREKLTAVLYLYRIYVITEGKLSVWKKSLVYKSVFFFFKWEPSYDGLNFNSW